MSILLTAVLVIRITDMHGGNVLPAETLDGVEKVFNALRLRQVMCLHVCMTQVNADLKTGRHINLFEEGFQGIEIATRFAHATARLASCQDTCT